MPAIDAPVVAVFVRLHGRERWHGVLRWDLTESRVEQGAWARLRLKEHCCRLSPDGRYLMYVASGPLKGPFSAYWGGGVAVSRLPWLAALTDIKPASVMGGGPSRHALPPDQQERLWSIFSDADTYYHDGMWPGPLGPAWKRANAADYGPSRVRRKSKRPTRLAAIAPIPRRALRLVALTDRTAVHSGAINQPRFFVESLRSVDAGSLWPLPDLRWVHPAPDGTVLAATHDARLQRLRLSPDSDSLAIRIREEHDLSRLKPRPGPAPRWATAPLGRKPP